MASIIVAARGNPRANARPRAGTITVDIDAQSCLSLTPSEARCLAAGLLGAADEIDQATVTAGVIQRAMAEAAA